MNYNNKKLKELKKWYECIAWTYIKGDRDVPIDIKLIIELIEELEDLKKLHSAIGKLKVNKEVWDFKPHFIINRK